LKKEIELNQKNIFPKHKEIWYISMWKNIWFESNWKWKDFKRPILVLKRIWTIFLVVSMTTKWKDNKFYHKLDEKYFKKESFVTLSQFKTIDKKRFIEKIWKLDDVDFLKIKNEIKKLF
jgi:hypothetical protein